ncbi:nuclear transport factor 2 family protein [Novosphingobium flavum]|uniref:nuclear transport factor 2 family protein n=1 Tax=Novosphingobium aerophilum TaxID=2839843 RepID=UPI00163B026C|nr:nuclear transport factor 2 family protein [Novosphingobium aerophilum]MBC2661864.1 nuclear transport factor 2 family protein [Novosphingobium aerophilum]
MADDRSAECDGWGARLARLEAEADIRRLIARYAFDVDDRRVEALRDLFAPDAVLRSADGVMEARGVDAIMTQFDGRFAALGAGHHVMHDVLIEFDGPTAARGRISGHAELWRNGTMMVAALRYADRYALTQTGWRFAERVIGFLYYVPVEAYPGILGQTDRNRAYARPLPADYPEPLPEWIAYHRAQAAEPTGA